MIPALVLKAFLSLEIGDNFALKDQRSPIDADYKAKAIYTCSKKASASSLLVKIITFFSLYFSNNEITFGFCSSL